MTRIRLNWSPEDTDTLMRMATDGHTGPQLAAALNRPLQSIYDKASALKLSINGRRRVDSWPPAKLKALDELVAASWTAAQVAQKLGATRSAVIGMARRRQAGPKPKPVQRAAVAVAQPAAPTPTTLAARPWITRQTGECAFPVEGVGADTLSCCAPVAEGRTYCVRHCQVVYQSGTALRARRTA